MCKACEIKAEIREDEKLDEIAEKIKTILRFFVVFVVLGFSILFFLSNFPPEILTFFKF